METAAQIITYWLCPQEPARGQCAALIQDLASRFDAPSFEPHVTIHVAAAGSEIPSTTFEQILKGLATYRLFVRGIEYSDEFTKTLFIQFKPNAALAQLSEDLRRVSASPSDYQLNPHLSLLYKDLDPEMKRQLATSISLPFDEIVFNRVNAVISPAEIRSRADVEAWRVIADYALTT
jgi:2'-5' RNA ligase